MWWLLACGGTSSEDTSRSAETETGDTGIVDPGPLEEQFAFVVIADPHVTGPGEHEQRLLAAVDWVNDERKARGIELVFVVGDIGWSDGLDLTRIALDELDVPYVPVIGDNEIHLGSEAAFDDVFTPQYALLADTFDDFARGPVEVDNPDYGITSWFQNFSFRYRGLKWVGLDWNSRSDDFVLGEMADLHDFDGGTWPFFESIVQDLPEPDLDEDVLLFSHHAMHLSPGAFDLAEMERITMLTGAVGGRIAANYAGHYHFDFDETLEDAGYDVHITDATWDDANTVRVVRVLANDATHAFEQELVVLPP